MSKFLWVGDPHGKMSIYQEFSGFLSDLQALIEERGIEKVIIAGDLFDTFAVVRSEILALWSQFFQQVSKKTHIIALVGNHDMAGANGGVSPMEPFKAYQNVTIVDHPIQLGMNPDLHGAPFMRSNAEFEAYCRSLKPGSILICHQSFNGATFENGFYDPHGADTEAVKHLASVVSGHVHKRQEFQNIFYPGTPFQHTFGDAGENKAVFEISLGSHGYTVLAEHTMKMPRYEVIKAESVAEIVLPTPDALTNYKIVARGTPSEIADFWKSEQVKTFKAGARRVVDAMTSVKPLAALSSIKGSTQKEKFNEYIKSKKWRTDTEQFARRAEEYLNS